VVWLLRNWKKAIDRVRNIHARIANAENALGIRFPEPIQIY
jgi:hypothetical protein